MSATQLDDRPAVRRKRTFASLLAAAAVVASTLGVVQPAHADDSEVWIWLTGNTGASMMYELSGFTTQADEDVSVQLVRDGESFARSTAPVTLDSSGGALEVISIPANAPVGSDYRLKVYDDTDALIGSSDTFNVYASTRRVTNPGDHQGGTEKASVQQGGVWTFNATAFAANGKLRATAVIDADPTDGIPATTVTLTGVGQQVDGTGAYWPLNAQGHTSEITRVKLAHPTTGNVPPTGNLNVTFSDGTNSITRTITIDAAVTPGATAIYNAGSNTVTVSGSGWLHPNGSGSVIAFKVDEGAYSHTTGSEAIHPQTGNPITNLTVWYATQAASTTGNFSVTFALPSLASGDHNVRLLSGSLHTAGGDVSRTVSAEFTVP